MVLVITSIGTVISQSVASPSIFTFNSTFPYVPLTGITEVLKESTPPFIVAVPRLTPFKINSASAVSL